MHEPDQERPSWTEIDRIFDLTYGLDDDEARTVLDRECAGRARLRSEVESLLDAANTPGPLDGGLEKRAGDLISEAFPRDEATAVQGGDLIGPYRIDHTLGSGGMGTVFLAHRADGQFEREVALKLLTNPISDDAARRRFLRERQILAGLRHPNIAALLDGGVTDNDVPYLVLEVVDGEAITDYCDHNRLSIEERVRLVLQASLAVQHAHRHGVIHRDLKPSNILVAEDGGDDRIFVVDFGIALPDDDVELTTTGQVIGTPGYMAPEQFSGARASVDRRSDVFALGVVLYQLITGEKPYQGTTAGEILVKVLEGDPRPPRHHRRHLSPDLDTIVMTCLAHEPGQRYDSARALADDLERYLDGMPVAARPVGIVTRLLRRARRSPRGTAFVLVAFLAATMATGSAIHSRRGAAAQARAAQRFGLEVERVDALLRHAHLAPLHDIRPEHELVRERLRWIEEERRRLGDLATGPGDYAIGRIHLGLGESSAAYEALSRAWQSGYREPEVASAYGHALGAVYREEIDRAGRINDETLREARYDELESEYRVAALKALRAERKSESSGPSELTDVLIALFEERWDDTARSADAVIAVTPWLYEAEILAGDAMRAAGHVDRKAGRHDAALLRYEDAAEHYREAIAIGESDPRTHLALCTLAVEVMETLFFGSGDDVGAWYDTALTSCTASSRSNPDAPQPHALLASAHLVHARQSNAQGRDPMDSLAKALDDAARAIAADSAFGPGHRVQADAHLYRSDFSQQRGLDPLEDLNAAIAGYERAIDINNADVAAHHGLGTSYIDLIHLEMDRGEDPESTIAAAIEAYTTALELQPGFGRAHNNLGIIHRLHGEHLMRTGRDPRPAFALAVTSFERSLEVSPGFSFAYNNLGNVFRDRGRWEFEHGIDPSGSLQYALQRYREAGDLNPGWAFPLLNSGLVHGHLGDYAALTGGDPTPPLERAAADLEEGIERIGGHPLAWAELGRIHLIAARCALEAGRSVSNDLAAADRALTKALAIDSDHALALQLRARSALIEAQARKQSSSSTTDAVRRAEVSIRRSLDVNPGDADSHLTAARLHLLKGEYDRAEDAITQALTIRPDHAEALAVLASIHSERARQDPSQTDESAQAKAALHRALQINPFLASRYPAITDDTP